MRISHSSKEMFLESSKKFFLHYFLKLRPKAKSSPLCFGEAVDEGLNALLLTKDISKAMVSFETCWNKYRNVGVVWSKSDLEDHLFDPEETPEAWESLRRRGVIILEEYNTQIMPRIKEVVAVQIDKLVPNEQGDHLQVKTDFIAVWEDGRRILFDNKTTSMAYKEDAVRLSEQLAIYYELLKEEYKLDAAGFIVIAKKVNKKKLPCVNINVIIDAIDEETFHRTLEQYDDVLAQIKTGVFSCEPSSCGSKFGPCCYRKFCLTGNMEGLEYK